MDKIAAVILSGGKSSRMGKDKATVTFKGATLLNHCQNILKSTPVDDIFISGKNGIPDQVKNLGPIGGVSSCLEHLKAYKLVLFTPVDMPLLTADIYNYLIIQPIKNMACFKGFHLPFIIKNNKEIRLKINNMIDSKQLAIHQLIARLDADEIETGEIEIFEENQFININNPKQLKRANSQNLICKL